VNVRFTCPTCEHPDRLDLNTPREWQCLACDSLLHVPAAPAHQALRSCAVCGNAQLYRKKDFPHWLGLLLLGLACLAFLVTNYLYQQRLAWGILLGSAALDGLLYLVVGDVVVCYRCGAQHRGFAPHPEHKPFELSIGERYRQEQLRREQLHGEKKSG
jgi:hypothetical protein